MGNNRIFDTPEASLTTADIQMAKLGIRKLELAGHNKEAQGLNRIINAYIQTRYLLGAEPISVANDSTATNNTQPTLTKPGLPKLPVK